ncbi:hypothetical protein AAG906_040984 [Vitis piasezkii]
MLLPFFETVLYLLNRVKKTSFHLPNQQWWVLVGSMSHSTTVNLEVFAGSWSSSSPFVQRDFPAGYVLSSFANAGCLSPDYTDRILGFGLLYLSWGTWLLSHGGYGGIRTWSLAPLIIHMEFEELLLARAGLSIYIAASLVLKIETEDCKYNEKFWTQVENFLVIVRKPNETMRLIVTISVGVVFGFLIGISFPTLSITKLNLPSSLLSNVDIAYIRDKSSGFSTQALLDALSSAKYNRTQAQNLNGTSKIWAPSNPRGAERLPPGIVAAESDFYLRRLWGKPSEDLTIKPKYLVTFTVGYDQKKNVDAAVKKFSEDFTILLFHYDGRTTEWDEFEWSKRAIHVSVRRQTKWWYAKRFLHPDIVAPYDYIFIWDEDLGVEHFNAEEYIRLVRKYGLEISQPGLEPNKGLTWQMTKRRGDREVHKETEEKPGWCPNPHLPPCAAFVEIMAPVFSRDAWRCVWHMLQNDLVHGWGLDFALRRCVEPAHEKIGVVDSQWIVHQTVPSLGNQGQAENGKAPWQGVSVKRVDHVSSSHDQCRKAYYKEMGINPTNSTVTRDDLTVTSIQS